MWKARAILSESKNCRNTLMYVTLLKWKETRTYFFTADCLVASCCHDVFCSKILLFSVYIRARTDDLKVCRNTFPFFDARYRSDIRYQKSCIKMTYILNKTENYSKERPESRYELCYTRSVKKTQRYAVPKIWFLP